MGFFSWKTQDTDKSISNSSSRRGTFTVYMSDNKGNKWREDEYDGYGRFGGKDYYELLAEMNGEDADRGKGIDIAYSGRSDIKFPNLSEGDDWSYVDIGPERCPEQGYFYDDREDDHGEEYEEDTDD